MAHYDLPPRAGLVNSAILYPLSRALFASRTRYPLAIDLGLSPRMAERLAGAGQRFTAINQTDAPLWPVSEAAVAGFAITEVDAGPRALPQPAEPDLNTILPGLTGSLFADIEAKAAFWQRARQTPQARNSIPNGHAHTADAAADIAPMLQAFRLAYTNLQRDLVAGVAAQYAAGAETTFAYRRRGVPHVRKLVGAHCLRFSSRLPACAPSTAAICSAR